MKKNLLLLSFGLAVCSIANAQTQPAANTTAPAVNTGVAKPVKTSPPEQRAKMRTAELNNKLVLTGDQQHKVFEIFVMAIKNMDEIKNSDVDEKAKHEKLKAANEELDASLKNILTPEQFKMYETIKEERKEKRQMEMKK